MSARTKCAAGGSESRPRSPPASMWARGADARAKRPTAPDPPAAARSVMPRRGTGPAGRQKKDRRQQNQKDQDTPPARFFRFHQPTPNKSVVFHTVPPFASSCQAKAPDFIRNCRILQKIRPFPAHARRTHTARPAANPTNSKRRNYAM